MCGVMTGAKPNQVARFIRLSRFPVSWFDFRESRQCGALMLATVLESMSMVKAATRRVSIKNAIEARRAKEYLVRRFGTESEFLTRGNMTEHAFINALDLYDFSDVDEDTLAIELGNFHKLCDKNLDDHQWAMLKNELRTQRVNDKTLWIQVKLTGEAYWHLQKFIDNETIKTGEKMMISDAILKLITN